MNIVRLDHIVAVPSVVIANKWWVFSELTDNMYAVGTVHYVSGWYVASQARMVGDTAFLGDAMSMLDALRYFLPTN